MSEGFALSNLGGVVLLTLPPNLDDDAVRNLEVELTEFVTTHLASGVILDLSMCSIIDSFMGRTLTELAEMLGLLGPRVIICGIRPAVALTLVEMGLTLGRIETARTAGKAMDRLRSL